MNYTTIASANTVRGKVQGNQMRYDNAFEGIDVVFNNELYRLKEEFIVTPRGRSSLPDPKQYGMDPENTLLVFKMHFQIDKDMLVLAESDTIGGKTEKNKTLAFNYAGYKNLQFNSSRGKRQFCISEDRAFFPASSDSSGNDERNIKVWKKLETINGRNTLFTGVPVTWLQNAPEGSVVVDPTIIIQPTEGDGKDNFIYRGGGGNDNYGASGAIQVGPNQTSYERRGLIQFDLSGYGLPDDIVSAHLQLYHYYYTGSATDFTMEAHKMLRDWAEGNASTWDNNSSTGRDWQWADELPLFAWNANGMQSGSDYSSTVLDDVLVDDTNGWYSLNVTDAVEDWIQTPSSNYGLALMSAASDISKAIVVAFRSSDYTTDPSLNAKLVIYSSIDPLASFEYDIQGRISKITYADGVEETNQYDTHRSWLTRITFERVHV
jgi:hypothetical protein